MPKTNRNGQAAVLKAEQLEEVFNYLPQPHDLIFQICYYTAARIGEVVQLQAGDIVGAMWFTVPGRPKPRKPDRLRSLRL
ncbi:MAG: hypothetical protein KME47_18200 [Nodosilinea sp. WJT8-NPBG4]|jgi:integrase|nr:hypothetical protein [Nodosilinea sp. WJT8-NPBG4]